MSKIVFTDLDGREVVIPIDEDQWIEIQADFLKFGRLTVEAMGKMEEAIRVAIQTIGEASLPPPIRAVVEIKRQDELRDIAKRISDAVKPIEVEPVVASDDEVKRILDALVADAAPVENRAARRGRRPDPDGDFARRKRKRGRGW